MKIKDLEKQDRPREKMLSLGARSLSNSELLAMLLRTGSSTQNAVDVARSLMSSAGGSLRTLSGMSVGQLCRIDGIGKIKALEVSAAMEIGRRMGREDSENGSVTIDNAGDAASVLADLYTTDAKEECWCLMLKRSRRIVNSVRISEGGETLTEIDIKAIVRNALDAGASAVILSHNHPSGNPRPSASDIKLTEKLRKALATFELVLMDHIIVSENGFYSFAEESVFHI